MSLELIQSVGMGPEEALRFANEFQDAYWKRFHVFRSWCDKMLEELRSVGFTSAEMEPDPWIMDGVTDDPVAFVIMSPFGRRLFIPKGTPYGELLRLSRNYPIQSASGDITNIAVTRIDRRLRSEGMRSRVIAAIHDAGYIDFHQSEYDKVVEIAAYEMLRTDHLPWLGECPLRSEVEVGPSLGELEVKQVLTTYDVQ